MDGTTTVLWHSAMWVYLSAATQRRILAGIDRAGGGAGPAPNARARVVGVGAR